MGPEKKTIIVAFDFGKRIDVAYGPGVIAQTGWRRLVTEETNGKKGKKRWVKCKEGDPDAEPMMSIRPDPKSDLTQHKRVKPENVIKMIEDLAEQYFLIVFAESTWDSWKYGLRRLLERLCKEGKCEVWQCSPRYTAKYRRMHGLAKDDTTDVFSLWRICDEGLHNGGQHVERMKFQNSDDRRSQVKMPHADYRRLKVDIKIALQEARETRYIERVLVGKHKGDDVYLVPSLFDHRISVIIRQCDVEHILGKRPKYAYQAVITAAILALRGMTNRDWFCYMMGACENGMPGISRGSITHDQMGSSRARRKKAGDHGMYDLTEDEVLETTEGFIKQHRRAIRRVLRNIFSSVKQWIRDFGPDMGIREGRKNSSPFEGSTYSSLTKQKLAFE